jgi:hypothetical protein
MTPEEFEFWQKAYLAALRGLSSDGENYGVNDCVVVADRIANLSIPSYRTAKATVKNTVYTSP